MVSHGTDGAISSTDPTRLIDSGSHSVALSLPTDFDVDHALGAYGDAAPLSPRDWRGHIDPASIPTAPHTAPSMTAQQVTEALRGSDVDDGWHGSIERPAAWAAFGDGDGGNAA
ncbi:hypothetical protein [Streptacidiphilus carbonis]|uniref:hypothetical protein n=1 Tax=Streptacidiphilus carbonis TaxID=105422 RepID=UPI0005A8F2FC|nr:hypothetical protein [Streptacidiphilus carbonis]